MTTIRSFQGQILYFVDDRHCFLDFNTRQILYRVENRTLKTFYGQIVNRFQDNCIQDFSSRILYRISNDGNEYKDFHGRIVYRYRKPYITDFSHRMLYRIDGDLTRDELSAFIVALAEKS